MKTSIEYQWSTCAGVGSWNAPGTMGSVVGALVYCIFSFLPSLLHFLIYSFIRALPLRRYFLFLCLADVSFLSFVETRPARSIN